MRMNDYEMEKAAHENNYHFSYEKGQKVFGPPKEWQKQPPQHGCEVFIGHIPRDCSLLELIRIFSSIGIIYQFRLMMENNISNRGYGFCCFTNKEDARHAIDSLNNFEMRPSKTIGVHLSVDNCKLFIGGIPNNKKREDILVEMCLVTDNVKDVTVYPSIEDKTRNRGFAFVEYTNHKSAIIARHKLQKSQSKLWGKIIHVDWAEPEPQVSEEIMSLVTNLHARNLLERTTEEDIRKYFVEAAGGIFDSVVKVRKLRDCAFIHFKERGLAELAKNKLNNTCFDGGVEIEINWAKPDQKKQIQELNINCSKFVNLINGYPHYPVNSVQQIISQEISDSHLTVKPINFPLDRYLKCSILQTKHTRRKNNTYRTKMNKFATSNSTELLDIYCQMLGLEKPEIKATSLKLLDENTGTFMTRYCCELFIKSVNFSYTTEPIFKTIEDASNSCIYNVLSCLIYVYNQSYISDQNNLINSTLRTQATADDNFFTNNIGLSQYPNPFYLDSLAPSIDMNKSTIISQHGIYGKFYLDEATTFNSLSNDSLKFNRIFSVVNPPLMNIATLNGIENSEQKNQNYNGQNLLHSPFVLDFGTMNISETEAQLNSFCLSKQNMLNSIGNFTEIFKQESHKQITQCDNFQNETISSEMNLRKLQ